MASFWYHFFGGFGFSALPHKVCERGQNFVTLCPYVLVVLDHSKEPCQLFDINGWIKCKDPMYLLWLGSYPSSSKNVP
jgi:hypothetical protein